MDGRSYTYGNATFWLSVYNRETKYVTQTGQETRTAGEEWSKVTNGMTLPLSPAQGFAVYARPAEGLGDSVIVRLPKNDDIYYYYGTYGEKLYDRYEQNLRNLRNSAELGNGKAGKLSFDPGKAATSESYRLTNGVTGTTFIFGNPTMGYIDIWGFIADNGLAESFGYLDADGAHQPVTKTSAEATTDTIYTLERYLPPMHAIIVTAASGTTLDLTLKTKRIVTAASQKERPLPASAPRKSSIRKGIMTVTAINPVSPRCNSRLLIGQGYNHAILGGEDAILTTLNIDKFSMTNTPTTPFNIYAVEDSCGLSIDLLDSIVNVPVSFYMSDLPYEPMTYLWFTGVNNIDGPLVLYDALTNTERPIIDGICITIETPEQNHERRYYIRHPGFDPYNDNPTTGYVEVEEPEDKAVKFIYENQIYILKNGHVYTIMGQRVR